ncbi:bifunctional [glutamine synthetase] adenylyltransferase/[glutamine synthetase]-adenylyl-L-tyrosine phosphorylase [Arachnia propionica]|uniref:Bifunctional [glutamine synthetase] adenylyltransferase/[glutamine synthetase]-adenylyl-L-tyrosine phosphorylase n=1 Tax=Arachnia propionica TaxID=1750 RepID=A0A3P1T3W0_9ACTN|nr:bifunctional [glutamine synthetase] adenylyltransferase/[glutamine synthetase]-adenylyl-L-tyrosine phosphorylase [Arachnia propionica]RRD03506.1 bifunctional [glutamine synthetase] adenylyltransferase/[glutamine synthetase]-adenylyl-L-tyrosine phosphorylase [Arachnia propionica]
MSRLNTTVGEFARRGFDSPSGAARVWEGWTRRLGQAPPLDLTLFEVAADRDQALELLARIDEAAPGLLSRVVADQGWCTRLLAVLGGSSVLARFLARRTEQIECLATEPDLKGQARRTELQERALGADGVVDPDLLRRANLAALVEIAAFDLTHPHPEQVVDQVAAELTHLADAVLQCALQRARAEVPGSEKVRLAVLAMGKAGGAELNYVSDVDVIHIAEPADGADADEAMQIGAGVAAALARICSAHTAEGTIWPLDAGLRPEGRAGPLVRSLASCETYYRTWAKNWEFQALLKARPAAGDQDLGQAFCDMVAPLVWQAAGRDGFLAEARAMRQRVISLIPPKEADREIKLGVGGLRDTEFSVQLLQLVHGRGDERLRVRGTFEALQALTEHGYIGRADGAAMVEAYRTQRVLEHRVQLRRLRRTHLVPDDEQGWVHLGRTLGRGPDEVQSAWRSSTRSVERLRQRIFFSPLLDAVSGISSDALRLSTTAAQERLRVLGFEDPRAALGHIQALTQGASRTVEIQRQLMPAMLGWVAEGPNPDFGLLAFRQLSDALGTTSWYMRALRDEGWMAQRLAHIASSSRYVVNLLMRAPEMVQLLAHTDDLEPRSRDLLTGAMGRAIARASDHATAIASVRALRRSELCRIALGDVLGTADVVVVGQALSDLAEATLDAGLELARLEVDGPPVGVIGMGRLGGGELSHSSDADVMFVIPDDSSPDGVEAATRLVRRACDIIGKPGPDPGLVVDADLRPEGRGGPLVRTVSSYLTYYERWAAVWEAQALLRARPVAGELRLAESVRDGVSGLRHPRSGLSAAQVAEIRRLKSRMENERIPSGADRTRHLKLGTGGLTDVEWSVQLLQLQHAGTHPVLRTSSTLMALEAAERVGVLSPEHGATLREAWLHVSRVRNAITLVRGRAGDTLPVDYRELAAVAGLLGYRHDQHSQLVDDTRRLMRLAARVVDVVFWGLEDERS